MASPPVDSVLPVTSAGLGSEMRAGTSFGTARGPVRTKEAIAAKKMVLSFIFDEVGSWKLK